jgi:transposase
MPRSHRNNASTGTWKEWRRRRALELSEMGWTHTSIAAALGVSDAAVSQWLRRAEAGGPDALRPKSRRGQGARLSEEQLHELPPLLDRGAEAFGFSGDLWTCQRIVQVIERNFGVRYHPDHVRRLLRKLHWSPQKPVVYASQRNDAAILDWLTRTWPALAKRAEEEGRTIVFADESGFYLSPTVERTWSPVGQTPVLKGAVLRQHLSVIGGMTIDGSLYVQIHRASIRAQGAVQFVRHLLMHIPGNILLLWDSARIHKSTELAEFRKLDTIGRLVVEYFPPYAPEVDPQEYVWHHLKHVDLRNLTTCSLDDLWTHLRHATSRLRARAGLMKNRKRSPPGLPTLDGAASGSQPGSSDGASRPWRAASHALVM